MLDFYIIPLKMACCVSGGSNALREYISRYKIGNNVEKR